MLTPEEHANIEKQWTNYTLPERCRWWQSETILKHIAKKVCGSDFEGTNWCAEMLRKTNIIFKNAISIGCGAANIELDLIEKGIVEHFYLIELSQEQLDKAIKSAEQKGIRDKITCYYGDFFSSKHNISNFYNLVFWSGSLHHMFNTKLAILTSYDILHDVGYLLINEYVGKSRFQYSNEEIEVANKVRGSLPQSFYKAPNSQVLFSKTVYCPTAEEMIATDISEAADSENIIPSINKFFPHAEIIHCGGLIYHLGLNDILCNIPEESELLYSLLKADDLTIQKKLYHYAFCLCPKHKSS